MLPLLIRAAPAFMKKFPPLIFKVCPAEMVRLCPDEIVVLGAVNVQVLAGFCIAPILAKEIGVKGAETIASFGADKPCPPVRLGLLLLIFLTSSL